MRPHGLASLGLALLASLGACGRLGFGDLAGDAGADGPADDAPADDADGDGVPEALDVCPAIADPGQHDEDGDGRGDACDGCPHRADDGADGDGDGVGDACDPALAATANRIVAFLPFDGTPLPAGWTLDAQNTTWSEGGDALAVALATSDVALVTAPAPPGQEVTIEASVTIDAVNGVGGSSPGRNVAVVDHLAGAAGSEDALMFGLHQDANAGTTAQVTGFLLSGGGFAAQFAATEVGDFLTPGATHALRYRRVGTARAIEVWPGGLIATTRPETGGRVGFRVRGLTVRLHHLIVIQ